jgi:hypothetical protein
MSSYLAIESFVLYRVFIFYPLIPAPFKGFNIGEPFSHYPLRHPGASVFCRSRAVEYNFFVFWQGRSPD